MVSRRGGVFTPLRLGATAARHQKKRSENATPCKCLVCDRCSITCVRANYVAPLSASRLAAVRPARRRPGRDSGARHPEPAQNTTILERNPARRNGPKSAWEKRATEREEGGGRQLPDTQTAEGLCSPLPASSQQSAPSSKQPPEVGARCSHVSRIELPGRRRRRRRRAFKERAQMVPRNLHNF